VLGVLEVDGVDWVASELPEAAPDWAASLCGMLLLSLFIESLMAASDFVVSLLVLCAASPLVVVVVVVLVWLCASAGFAGVVACAIKCGVVLSDCGVAWGVVVLSGVLLGVAVLSGVVLLGVAVVLLAPFL